MIKTWDVVGGLLFVMSALHVRSLSLTGSRKSGESGGHTSLTIGHLTIWKSDSFSFGTRKLCQSRRSVVYVTLTKPYLQHLGRKIGCGLVLRSIFRRRLLEFARIHLRAVGKNSSRKPFDQLTNIRTDTQSTAPEGIQGPFAYKAIISEFELNNNKNITAPPEEPPQESNWFTGLSVRPMRLLTVSPSCTGKLVSESMQEELIHFELVLKSNEGNVPEGFAEGWSRRLALKSYRYYFHEVTHLAIHDSS
jgi:hypothetical protein